MSARRLLTGMRLHLFTGGRWHTQKMLPYTNNAAMPVFFFLKTRHVKTDCPSLATEWRITAGFRLIWFFLRVHNHSFLAYARIHGSIMLRTCALVALLRVKRRFSRCGLLPKCQIRIYFSVSIYFYFKLFIEALLYSWVSNACLPT